MTSAEKSIASFGTAIGAPVGIANASFLVSHFRCLQEFLRKY